MKSSPFVRILLFFLAATLFAGCAAEQGPKPPNLLFFSAKSDLDKGLYQSAFTKLQTLVNNYPDTRFANYAFILMGDAQFEGGSASLGGANTLNEALSFYEAYLQLNPESELAPYVLYRMILINHVLNVEGVLAVGTDVNVLIEIIDNYKRFYLLHPESIYQKDTRLILRDSRMKLALYEEKVGDWYFGKKLFTSAAARYRYVLETFPDYTKTRQVARKLIETYSQNQQPYLARETEKIYGEFFN